MDTTTEEALLHELAVERQARQAAEELAKGLERELEHLHAAASRLCPRHLYSEKLLLQLKAPALLTDTDDRIVLLNRELHALLELPQQPAFYVGVSLQEFELNALLRPQHALSELAQVTLASHGETQQRRKVLERDRVPLAEGAIWFFRDVTLKHLRQRELELQSELQEEYPSPILRLSFAGEILL